MNIIYSVILGKLPSPASLSRITKCPYTKNKIASVGKTINSTAICRYTALNTQKVYSSGRRGRLIERAKNERTMLPYLRVSIYYARSIIMCALRPGRMASVRFVAHKTGTVYLFDFGYCYTLYRLGKAITYL